MVAVLFAPSVVPPFIASTGTILGLFGLGLFIAMQCSRRELVKWGVALAAIVVLFGLFTKLKADETVVNDPAVALCRALDPNDNWFLYWLYDCADLLKNAGR